MGQWTLPAQAFIPSEAGRVIHVAEAEAAVDEDDEEGATLNDFVIDAGNVPIVVEDLLETELNVRAEVGD